ncbi:MAG: ABC transporter ATP-binding protein [Candidatus Bathyarchaeota archaeon]|nr:ABC transporter ATP-binding protein [Candidatus Bathyarchaeota archaeon]
MPLSDQVVAIRSVYKVYQQGHVEVEALKSITLNVSRGEFIAICGPSGSGKTTLLNIIGGIDRPTSGKILVLDQDLTVQDENFLADFRCNNVGFVFQSYNLVSTLTVAENIAFPMEWSRKSEEEIEIRVAELLGAVDLQHRANHFPAQLSGGEQQRVAFARALANDPELILADEPTGNLDTKNGQKIVQVLQMVKANGRTVVAATHDSKLIQLADRVMCIEDGRLIRPNE